MGVQHTAFLTSQAAHIEPEVYRIQYPNIQYPELVPVDNSAPEFAGQVTYFSMDGVGEAQFFGTHANDVPFVDTERQKFDVRIENLAIGYKFNEFELEYAMRLGINLPNEQAMIARRVMEEKTDQIVLNGQSQMGWDGLLNSSVVNATNVAGANANARVWSGKDGPAIAQDINDAISSIEQDSLQVEMADTVLLPVAQRNLLATKQFSTASDTNILTWVQRNNVYTAQTGRPLLIRTCRGLESAGAGNTARMVVYANRMDVLKLHRPMPFRFWPAQQWMFQYYVPGVCRLGGLEIRRPGAVRYRDGI